MVVLVTGANGQLGRSLMQISKKYQEITFHFFGSSELDITQKSSIVEQFNIIRPDFCINAAAYTAVDQAETDFEIANLVNNIGAGNIAEACKDYNVVLFHISTDFVFDGSGQNPYIETDMTNPLSVYGKTKLLGEDRIRENLQRHFIIRTSWLYSAYGHNFVKTMLKLGIQGKKLTVIDDQIGTPTHASDLAEAMILMMNAIQVENLHDVRYGLYHFSNQGSCSWYEFAKKIFLEAGIDADLKPISSNEYQTKAQRPHYSVLNKSKVADSFNLKIRDWDERLHAAIAHEEFEIS